MKTSLIKLENFLNQHRCDSDNNWEPTHMSYGKLQGKFHIDVTEQNDFIKLYSKAIKDAHNLSILEKPKEYGPLVIDIDIKLLEEEYDHTNNVRLYDDKLINSIIKLYTDELNGYIESNDNKQYDFFIFEKNKPTIKNNIVKDGFHIIIPKLCLSFNDKFYIREQVIKKANEHQLFDGFYETADNIIDKAVIKSNGWFLYGSTKPDRIDDPYKITKVLRYLFNDNYYEDITNDIIDVKLKSIIKYLSINNVEFYGETNRTKCKTIKTETTNNPFNNTPLHDCNDKQLVIKQLLDMLNDSRAREYNMWRNIMLIINNELGKDGIDLAHKFSKKSMEHYNEKSVNEFYYRIKKNDSGLKLPTLKMYAKEDNPDEYNKLFKNYDNNGINNNFNIWKILEDMNHSDMAKLYHKLNPAKYVYSNTLGWFEYNNYNILIPYNKSIPTSLLSDITNKLQDLIIYERNKLKPPVKTNDMSKDEYDKLMGFYDNCMKLAKKGYINIGNSSYIKNIIDYLSNLYNVDRLDTLLDANDKLLAFDNKLFDFHNNCFRNIEPTDYITKTTKYNLPEKSNDDFKFINKLLSSIFENNEVVEYWLATTGLSLFGNKLESLYIHTGSGGNGKGLLSSILVKGLGDYMYCADNTFLTSVFKSGQANPTLAKCQGIRYLLVSEPDDGSDDVKFNVDFIKMLTGGDIITTRDLFKSNISYKPQFTPFVQCNNKPKLGKIDNGIKRRLKIINYPLKFVDNPTKQAERPIDYTLKEKLTNGIYKQFILLLIEKAVEYKDKKLIQPSDVENETKEYFDENDPVKGWLQDYFEKTDDTNDKISASELYTYYLSDNNYKISIVKFSEYMKLNEIDFIKPKNKTVYIKIKRKIITNEF